MEACLDAGSVPDLFVITLMGDVLHVFYPKYGYTLYTMRLDGKKYSSREANSALGEMATAEALGNANVAPNDLFSGATLCRDGDERVG